MGQLVEGEWTTEWYDTSKSGGRFVRSNAGFRNWITPDGAPGPSGEGGFPAETGRYHLYVSYACPWAHRALIYRALKGLAPHISISAVHPYMGEDGWTFETGGYHDLDGDALLGKRFLREVYLAARPEMSGRVTVPILWDKRRETIVSNESSEIIRMFDTAFEAVTGAGGSMRPEPLRETIDALNEEIYGAVNNGVYKCGFATTQEAYDEAVEALFACLDRLDARLSAGRYLTGPTITEADWRLFPTLVRFDGVYVGHFKCDRRTIREYPALWPYLRDLYQVPGVSETVRMRHIRDHYYRSHETINPHRIVPTGPAPDFSAPHGREALTPA